MFRIKLSNLTYMFLYSHLDIALQFINIETTAILGFTCNFTWRNRRLPSLTRINLEEP
jgi:hypothetical protein